MVVFLSPSLKCGMFFAIYFEKTWFGHKVLSQINNKQQREDLGGSNLGCLGVWGENLVGDTSSINEEDDQGRRALA